MIGLPCDQTAMCGPCHVIGLPRVGPGTVQHATRLNDSDSGAMGVRMEQGTLGATIGPPALMEYAVLPEGVEMMRPSACVGPGRQRRGASPSGVHRARHQTACAVIVSKRCNGIKGPTQ